VDVIRANGGTPLCNAARRGNTDVAKTLIEHGADVNAHSSSGMTPLQDAIVNGHNDITELLLNNGARCDSREQYYDHTAMHQAAIKGNKVATELLLDTGVDVNAKDRYGHTPLYYAGRYGQRDVAELLAASGGTVSDPVQNYGKSACLQKSLEDGEAYMWYLGHCGWAVKTRNHLLIFDYMNNGVDPAELALANGHVNPAELSDQSVFVFVTHEHPDHFDSTIFAWDKAVNNITYVYGCKPEELQEYRESGYNGPEYEYIGPRESRTIENMEILTIESNDAGVGFLVSVDGLKIYHAGDHAGWREGEREGFTREIDYLAEQVSNVDMAFVNVTGCHVQDTIALAAATSYTVDELSPKVMIPTHASKREYVYAQFADKMARKGCSAEMCCPQHRGDCYIYRMGATKPVVQQAAVSFQ
jgi:L-ascorbate metabolism protein UlaG (beta-lactamase superfamily)